MSYITFRGAAVCAAALAAACGGLEKPTEPCAQRQWNCLAAEVSIDGQEDLLFDQEARLTKLSTHWSIDAFDLGRRYSISIFFSPNEVAAPEAYPVGSDAVKIWFARPHPTDPSKQRLSSTSGGEVTFDKIGEQGGEIRGSFDGTELIRDNPDEQIHVTLSNGVFFLSGQ